MAFVLATGGCQSPPVDKAAFAAEKGVRTAIVGTNLGSCSLPGVGWKVCQFEEPETLPKLQIFFMNPGNYAVSDCDHGLLGQGSVGGPGLVEVDLSPLLPVIQQRDFCFLQIEAEERWDGERRYPILGGFLLQVYERGYLPTPAREDIRWCKKIYRTTAGRTVMEDCQ